MDAAFPDVQLSPSVKRREFLLLWNRMTKGRTVTSAHLLQFCAQNNIACDAAKAKLWFDSGVTPYDFFAKTQYPDLRYLRSAENEQPPSDFAQEQLENTTQPQGSPAPARPKTPPSPVAKSGSVLTPEPSASPSPAISVVPTGDKKDWPLKFAGDLPSKGGPMVDATAFIPQGVSVKDGQLSLTQEAALAIGYSDPLVAAVMLKMNCDTNKWSLQSAYSQMREKLLISQGKTRESMADLHTLFGTNPNSKPAPGNSHATRQQEPLASPGAGKGKETGITEPIENGRGPLARDDKPSDDDDSNDEGDDEAPVKRKQYPSDAAKTKYTVGVYLDRVQHDYVERTLKNKRVLISPGAQLKSHPVTRVISQHVAATMYEMARKRAGDGVIVDIGGDLAWHHDHKHKDVHCCFPATQAEDVHRYQRMIKRVKPPTDKPATLSHCRHRVQDCPCIIGPLRNDVKVMYCNHSLYYITERDICDVMHNVRTCTTRYAAVYNYPDIEGSHMNHEVMYTTYMVANERWVDHRCEPANVYKHSALDWLLRRGFDDGKGNAIHWSLEFTLGGISVYQFEKCSPGTPDPIGLFPATPSFNDVFNAPATPSLGFSLRPLSLSYGTDTASLDVKLVAEKITNNKVYRVGDLFAFSATDYGQSEVLVPKAAIGEVAIKMAGRVRDTDALVSAYAHARATLNRMNLSPDRLAVMVPYVAYMGLYRTIEHEARASLAHDGHKALADHIHSRSKDTLLSKLWGWASKHASRPFKWLQKRSPHEYALAAALWCLTCYLGYRATIALLRKAIRGALGDRLRLLRLSKSLEGTRLEFVSRNWLSPIQIVGLRQWAGNEPDRVADAAFLGYAYSHHPVAVTLGGLTATATSTWVTILLKPYLRKFGLSLRDRFFASLGLTQIAPWLVTVLAIAPLGEEMTKRMATFALQRITPTTTTIVGCLADMGQALAHDLQQIFSAGIMNNVAGQLASHCQSVASSVAQISQIQAMDVLKLTPAQQWLNAWVGYCFGIWESNLQGRTQVAQQLLWGALHGWFAFPSNYWESVGRHFGWNLVATAIQLSLMISTGVGALDVIGEVFPPALLVAYPYRTIAARLYSLLLGDPAPDDGGETPQTWLETAAIICGKAVAEEVIRRHLARAVKKAFKLWAGRVCSPTLADFIVATAHTAAETRYTDGCRQILARLACHWSLQSIDQGQAMVLHTLFNWFCRYTGRGRPLSLSLTGPFTAAFLEEPGRRIFSQAVKALLQSAGVQERTASTVAKAVAVGTHSLMEHNRKRPWYELAYRLVCHYALQSLPIPVAIVTHAAHNALVYWLTTPGVAIERNDVCWPMLNMAKLQEYLTNHPKARLTIDDMVDDCRPRLALRLLGPACRAIEPVVSRQCKNNHICSIVERIFIEPIVEGADEPLSSKEVPVEVKQRYARIITTQFLRLHAYCRPHRVQSTPMKVWSKRFPAAKRDRLVAIWKERRGLLKKDFIHKLFVKKEKIPCATTMVDGQHPSNTIQVCLKAPRAIQGISDERSAALGPWTHGWFNAIKAHQTYSNPYIHTSGMNALKLGQWFDHHYNRITARHGACRAIGVDGEVWDARMTRHNLEVVTAGMARWHPPKQVLRARKEAHDLRGATATGVTYKDIGHVASGDETTSVANGEFNLDLNCDHVRQYLPNILEHIDHMAMGANGDDNILLCSPWLYDRLLSTMDEHYRAFNHVPKITRFPDAQFADYCSGYFFPTVHPGTGELTRVWGMKPGRAMAKGMWRLAPDQAGGDATDVDWLRGMAMQYNLDVAHIPILRAQRDYLMRAIHAMDQAGVTKRKPIFEAVQRPRAPLAFPCTAQTMEFTAQLYPKLAISDLVAIEKMIAEASGPCLLDSEVLRTVLATDIGFKTQVSEFATIDHIGCHHPPANGRPVAIRPDSVEQKPRNHRFHSAPYLYTNPIVSCSPNHSPLTPIKTSMSNAGKKSTQSTTIVVKAPSSSVGTRARSGSVARGNDNVKVSSRAIKAPPRKARSGGGQSRQVARPQPRNVHMDLGGQSFEAQVRKLMFQLAFPDLTEPPTLGMNRNGLTAPFRLFHRWNAGWSTDTTQLAGALPVNELFIAMYSRHPSLAMSYNSVIQGAQLLVFKQGNNNNVTIEEGEWIDLDQVQTNPVSSTSQIYQPIIAGYEGDEADYAWVNNFDTASGPPVLTIAVTDGTTPFPAAGQFQIMFVCYSGNRLNITTTTVVVGGAAVGTLSFTMPAVSGWYAFYPIEWAPTAAKSYAMSISSPNTSVAGALAVFHDNLPAGFQGAMESTRINAGRGVMTNFTAALYAEGGAVAYEVPSADRFDEYIYTGLAPCASAFSVTYAQDGSQVIRAKEGLSAVAHPNINGEFINNGTIGSNQANVPSQQVRSKPSFEDITGPTLLVIKTALAIPQARDGMWQAYWHVEGETGNQLYAKRGADYSPLVVIEAESRFRNFRTISGNPDHFKAGLAVLNRLDKIGDGMIKSGIFAGAGGYLKSGAGHASTLLRAFSK